MTTCRRCFRILSTGFKPPVNEMTEFSVSASLSEILDGEFRLDATYYTSAVYQARKALEKYTDNSGTVATVADFSTGTFNPPPIKRIYTDNAALGTPYMLPQEMFDFYWSAKKYVLAEKMSNIEDWYLKSGWVVLTQSGSVGKPYFATEADESVVLSQNAIRIPPKDQGTAGYLYAYLSTWIGQTLLKKDEFGITVKHIRPHHVDGVPVPDFPTEIKKKISVKVLEAFRLRSKAIELLDQAKAMIYEELGAPPEPPAGDPEEL
jgi:type I restriction enzyme S subunit